MMTDVGKCMFCLQNGTLYEMIEPYMTFNIDSPCYMEMQAYCELKLVSVFHLS